MAQAKGAAVRVTMDQETAFRTAKVGAAREPRTITYGSDSVLGNQGLLPSPFIRGNLNPTEPSLDNMDVSGSLTMALDTKVIGLPLDVALSRTTTEAPTGDIKVSAPTITIVGTAGTFSTDQTAMLVGDRVMYANGQVAYITVRTSGFLVTLDVAADGGGGAPTAAAAGTSVEAIVANLSDSTPGSTDLTTVSGVCTFDTPQPAMSVGQQVIYSGTTRGYISAVTSTTVVNLITDAGHPVADVAGVDLETIEAQPRWNHVFTIPALADLGSLVIERGFLDMTTPEYVTYDGCSINTLGISADASAAGEVSMELGIVGGNETSSTTAYTATVAAVDNLATKFKVADCSVKIDPAQSGFVAETKIKSMSFNLNNNLDTDEFRLIGTGIRSSLPASVREVSGEFTASFEDTVIMDYGLNNTTIGLQFIFQSGSDVLTIQMTQVKLQRKTPDIPDGSGVTISPTYQAFFTNSTDNTDASAVKITLNNLQPGY